MCVKARAWRCATLKASKEADMWWNDGWSSYWTMPWMVFGPLMMIGFAVFCMAIMSYMMRGSHGGRAIDILKGRYARGEINQAEFEERRRLLES
jgi:putative membrane protein